MCVRAITRHRFRCHCVYIIVQSQKCATFFNTLASLFLVTQQVYSSDATRKSSRLSSRTSSVCKANVLPHRKKKKKNRTVSILSLYARSARRYHFSDDNGIASESWGASNPDIVQRIYVIIIVAAHDPISIYIFPDKHLSHRAPIYRGRKLDRENRAAQLPFSIHKVITHCFSIW